MKKSLLIAAAFLAAQGCTSIPADGANKKQHLTNKDFADRISATCAGYGKAARDNGGNFQEVFNDCMNHAVAVIEDQESS